MKQLLFVLTGLLLSSAVHSQTTNEFNLKIGWQQLRLKDEAASALVYKGQLPTVGFQWQHQTPQDLWQGQLQGSYGSFFPKDFPNREIIFLERNAEGGLDTVRVNARGSNILLRADLGWVRKLGTPEANDRNWQAVGANISEELFYPQGFVTSGLMNAVTFAPQAMAAFGAGSKGQFTVGITIPIAALTTRLPYHQTVSMPGGTTVSGLFKQGSQWSSVDKHQQIRIQVGYKHHLGNHWQTGLQYEFAYLRNTTPRNLFVQQHTINAFIGRRSFHAN